MIDGHAAAQTLLGYGDGIDRGYCLHYVWQAYKTHGARTDRSAPTALVGWERSDGKHPGDRNPPPGVPVWWGRRYDGNADGDVVISLGGGRVVATDWPSWGVVGITTIDEREAQIGREYLGWTEAIFDVPVYAPPAPDLSPAPVTSEEDDMIVYRWNGEHCFAVGYERIYHIPDVAQLGTAEALYGPRRELDNQGLTVLLLTQGIHWDAVDAVLRGAAFGANGRYWSRQIAEGEAQRAAQSAAQKTLDDVLATAQKIAVPA